MVADAGAPVGRARVRAQKTQRSLVEATGTWQPTLHRITSGDRVAELPEPVATARATGHTVARLTGIGGAADRVQRAARASGNGAACRPRARSSSGSCSRPRSPPPPCARPGGSTRRPGASGGRELTPRGSPPRSAGRTSTPPRWSSPPALAHHNGCLLARSATSWRANSADLPEVDVDLAEPDAEVLRKARADRGFEAAGAPWAKPTRNRTRVLSDDPTPELPAAISAIAGMPAEQPLAKPGTSAGSWSSRSPPSNAPHRAHLRERDPAPQRGVPLPVVGSERFELSLDGT